MRRKNTAKIVLLLVLCTSTLLMSFPVFAKEGQAKIDSLLSDLSKQQEDTNKAKILMYLSGAYEETNPEKGIEYGLKALALAKQLKWQRGEARIYTVLGTNNKTIARNNKALEYYITAAKLYHQLGDKSGEGRTTGNMGTVYRALGDSVRALDCFQKAVHILEESGEKKGVAIYTGNIGNLYCDELHNYPKALEYMGRSLKYFEEAGEKSGIARTSLNMGNVHARMNNFTGAIACFRRTLEISEQIDNRIQAANSLCNIGGIYLRILETTINNKNRKSVAQNSTNELPFAPYKPDKGVPADKAGLLAGAFEYLKRGLAISEEIGFLEGMIDCQRELRLAYKLSGDYQHALQASDEYHKLFDSVYSMDNEEQIVKLSVGYEYDRLRLADSLKTAEREKIATINLKKQKSYTYMGLVGIAVLTGFSFFIVKERKKSEKERKKSDGLLLNILPEEVAKELKAKGATTARHYDNVTVLFTDFVNFTQVGEHMSPQGLIDELHACFRAFDEITTKYQIEKIKTIGDAYLAVCGLPLPDAQHAENVVKAALEISAFMADRLAKLGSNRTFALRVGIHSGTVVAGIVGVKKFAYDIWGDTVNTAARMEQNSESSKINLSQTTYDLVKDTVKCTYRGEIDVKG